jgi:CheY-like chemotaxis protein
MPHHILIVDDGNDVRLILGDLFGGRGYPVSNAEDGAAALKLLENTAECNYLDLIIADYQMPNMNAKVF